MSRPPRFAIKRALALALLAVALLVLPPTRAQEKPGTGPPAPPHPDFTDLPTGTVTRVETADTLVVDLAGTATTVRLIGIFVPEGVTAREAQAFVSRLLTGEHVYLREEPTWPRDETNDRIWAYVFRAPDGLLANLELVRLGYARVAGAGPFEYRTIFEAYEQVARKLRKGLWEPVPTRGAPPPATQPAQPAAAGDAPAATPPADDNTTVYVTEHGRKYHRQGCVYVRNGAVAITLKDARARGLTPCKRCEPPE